jgi:RNA polymerase sigma factor (sigma-70 family)
VRSELLKETHGLESAEFCLDIGVSVRQGKGSLAEQVEACYVRHHDSLYRFLVAIGCPVELVPDLLQEAFCRLFESLHGGMAIDQPRSWLVRVLYNMFLNHVRKHKREAELDEASASVSASQNGTALSDPEREYGLHQRAAQLAHAMQQLTPTQSR